MVRDATCLTGPLATAGTGDNQVTDGGYCVTDNPQFRVELNRPKEDVAVVELKGEVDLYTAPQFKDILFQAIRIAACGSAVAEMSQ